MIYTIKKTGESNERLFSRSKKLIQRSRLLARVKQGAYHKKKKTKRFVRQAAVMRSTNRKRRERERYFN